MIQVLFLNEQEYNRLQNIPEVEIKNVTLKVLGSKFIAEGMQTIEYMYEVTAKIPEWVDLAELLK